jgi:hypothetical protein
LRFERELLSYCRERLAQLEEFRPVLTFFQSEHWISRYGGALEGLIHEFEQSHNDDATKEQNVHHYMQTNVESNYWFGEDISAILTTGQRVLPKDMLAIPAFWAERLRKQQEAREEAHRREHEAYLASMKLKEAEDKRKRQLELASELGLSPKGLERIQSSE